MRVCMILEGSYPYVYGGVSSWTHQYIQAMPNVEFILWCVGAKASDKGRYKYQLPENVIEVHEVFLDDALRVKMKKKKVAGTEVTDDQKEELKKLFEGKKLNWDLLFQLFQNQQMNPVEMLMSPIFLDLLMKICEEQFPYVSFAEYFHTVRSMMLPELYLLTQHVPQADIYHATATGYSGLLGSLGKWKYAKPFILTEHGIYTREREEEILRADWVLPFFRQQWIDLFYLFSDCAYAHADYVTALFARANQVQQELGCDSQKLRVTPNGVHLEEFSQICPKKENGWIDIGAVVRIAKIKDIKTMIYSFAELKTELPRVRLHILGDVDDQDYFLVCQQLVEQLGVEDIYFQGVVDVSKYMETLDFTILTSISEGQPLAVLESFAAGRACVTTDVGCCRELILGEDEFGPAGICVPPMDKERIFQAMRELCINPVKREQMGQAGKARVMKYYTHEISMERYRQLYQEVQ